MKILKMRKQNIKETMYDHKITMMDLTTMSSEDVTYYAMRKEEIKCKIMGHPPSNE